MAQVERALSRLEGVDYVSAGWETDQAVVRAKPGTNLDRNALNAALKGTEFTVTRLEPAR